MFGWVLRKGIDGATGAKPAVIANPDDTALADIPDTPAPIFAARAIKRAVFGTPAPPRDENTKLVDADAEDMTDKPKYSGKSDLSPTKPTGILLTPGTSTSRRKTVTFRHDVKVNAPTGDAGSIPARKSRSRRTRLTEALEKSRRQKREQAETQSHASEDEDWVEDDEDDIPACDHDITIDLNEPHSQSGKYWKDEFEKYRGEAAVEMEKLVKYKQLAKSYAKMKDAEAMELRLRLKEEQDKVTRMEEGIATQASKLATKMVKGEKEAPGEMKGLAQQTALAIKYREQVKELEAMLQEKETENGVELDKGAQHTTSPRTQKTILETQRELRKARSQMRELNDVRQRLNRVETRNKTLTEENGRLRKESSSARDLEWQIKQMKAEAERKQEEHDSLKRDYETIKENAKARHGEATWVVQQKDEKISELKREIRSLKTKSLDSGTMHKKLDDALLIESAKVIGELKKEVELLGGSRKRSLGKKVDALAANLKSLGYQPETWEPTETHGLQLSPQLGERRLGELPDLPNDLPPTETLDLASSEKKDRPSRTIKLAATSSGARVVSSIASGRPKSMTESNRQTGSTSTRMASEKTSNDKLEALREKRERRWREFVPREEKPTIASLATGVAELEAPTISVDGDEGDWRQNYEAPSPFTPLRSRRKTSGGSTTNGGSAATEAAAPTNDPLPARGRESPKIDLVTDRFAKVGATENPESSILWTNASKTGLPADRLGAALARIEQRKKDRLRLHGRSLDKENVRP